MKERRFSFVALLCFAMLAVSLLIDCSKSTGSKNDSWSIPSKDGSITASLKDDGKYGYVLSVQGSGHMDDFSSAKDAPWYSISGRISSIELPDGLTHVGANAFLACSHLQDIVIPNSVASYGANAFPSKCKVCVYETSPLASDPLVYVYSKESPKGTGRYWHIDGNKVVVWENMRILFVGNSFTYTHDIDVIFGKLAESSGRSLTVERIAIGAHYLSQFADPSDEGGAELEKRLTSSSDYDIIILQEQSVRPITNYDQFLDGARRIVDRISKTQTSCKVYLYETWGYPGQSSVIGSDIVKMEANLRSAYDKAAKELGVAVCHVGQAFTSSYQNHPEISLLGPDARHPSYAGSFLSACVHAVTVLGLDVRACAFDGTSDGDISANQSSILKSIAYTTVTGGK